MVKNSFKTGCPTLVGEIVQTKVRRPLLLALLFLPVIALSADNEYKVTSSADGQAEGTLRTILNYACNSEGSDMIIFMPINIQKFRIYLKEPLVIPKDCKGPVTVTGAPFQQIGDRGLDNPEVILDASHFTSDDEGTSPGDLCMLDIYSERNEVYDFTFVGNKYGAAVCVYGRYNKIYENRIGIEEDGVVGENLYGMVASRAFSHDYPEMDGSSNHFMNNLVNHSLKHGAWLHADDIKFSDSEVNFSGGNGIDILGSGIVIANNEIVANGGCPTHDEIMGGQPKECTDEGAYGGGGIYVRGGSNNILIGGESFAEEKNIIQYNKNGGVVLADSFITSMINITHNQISNNYGKEANIDLIGEGTTLNDLLDDDIGPNGLLNFADHLQAIELVPDFGGKRYFMWGAAFYGDNLELYGVSPEDYKGGETHGGGDLFLADMDISNSVFSAVVHEETLKGSRGLTAVSFVGEDTSEFSINAYTAEDNDFDGIPDELEIGDGTPDSGGTSPEDADSDGDGLPDPVEDKNRNGKWEPGKNETCAFCYDSDADGLSDFVETHGDGVYDEGKDTDPYNADTDNDSLADGEEDFNSNGVWDGYLKETSPLIRDSDSDGFFDNMDSCPSIANPGQEPWYCN